MFNKNYIRRPSLWSHFVFHIESRVNFKKHSFWHFCENRNSFSVLFHVFFLFFSYSKRREDRPRVPQRLQSSDSPAFFPSGKWLIRGFLWFSPGDFKLKAVFRFRIGSGFNQVSGPGWRFGIRIGIRNPDMIFKNRKKLRNFMFGSAGCSLFFPVAWTSFMEV
jgi:hypothetical protein